MWSGFDFDRATGKRIRVNESGASLQRGVTIADELGKCNDRDRETISGRRIARKIFHVGRFSGRMACLCPYLECDRNGGQLEISINGHVVQHSWSEDRPYWTDRWTPIDVPVEWLCKGDNDVCFRSMDESVWSLLIESSRQPDRSAVSEDGGSNWRTEELGWNDGCDGEYMVRLWIDQYPESATLESNVVDHGCDPNGGVAVVGPYSVSLMCERTGKGTAVLQFRSGSTPVPRPDTWSGWQEGSNFENVYRFGQWRVNLGATDPNATPVLESVSLTVNRPSCTSWSVGGRSQQTLAKSSYRFASGRHDEPRAERLRDRWKLEEVVRGSVSEWEAYLRLRQWVRDQWEDGWDMGAIDFCPPWDAMLILELTRRKLSLGMCTHYATVMSQCCAALGLNARTQIMRSHCINEVWSTDHQKWVAMDIGGDNNDETRFVYHFERDGEPLSAVECHEAWVSDDYADVNVSPAPPPATEGRYEVEKRLRLFERFMISLRTDELRSLEPGESEHGKGSYHYDGYLFWEDDRTKPLPWFSNHTARTADLYWSINETYIHLLDSDGKGCLKVILESPTPNLSHFERESGPEKWERVEDCFDWRPESKGSELCVRSVNHHGRPGVISVVKVLMDD